MLEQDINNAIAYAEQNGFDFSSMALSKESLFLLAIRLDSQKNNHILELGGGASTIFWDGLINKTDLNLKVTTLEHDVLWMNKLKNAVNSPHLQLITQRLRMIDDITFEQIFTNPDHALNIWNKSGEWVPEHLHNYYAIHNTFYGDFNLVDTKPSTYNALIVDGPHGNGRALSFPILANALTEDAVVLLDDFDHYPFLEYLGRIFHFQELDRKVELKHWVLLQLQGRKL